MSLEFEVEHFSIKEEDTIEDMYSKLMNIQNEFNE
jgi:hypothetical protein